MKNMKMNLWSVVIAALVTCAASVPLMAQEQGVEARPDNLPWLNGNTGDARWDKDGEGTEVSVDDGWMFSKIFKPEDGEHFVVYGATKAIFNDGQGTYVDVGYDPSAFTVRRAIDVHVQQDRVRIMVRLSGTAAMFPFYAQGNLGGGNGGEGGDGGAHWAVKSTNEIPVIQLEINEPGAADDYVVFGDNGGTLTVTVQGGSASTCYSICLGWVSGDPAGELQAPATSFESFSLDGEGGYRIVPLHGRKVGKVTINATDAVANTTPAEINTIELVVIPRVTFDPSPIVTGYSLPVAESTIHRDATATVTPPECANDIQFRITGQNRLKPIAVGNRDATTGAIALEVFGNSGTPDAVPNGDTTIESFWTPFPAFATGQTQAVVVIPDAIAKPYPQADGIVQGQNILVNNTTSPAANVAAPQVIRMTAYVHWLTIAVNDQFGNRLDALYAGQPVTEFDKVPMNQNMQADGTYRDPVGKGVVDEIALDPDDPLAIAWPNQAPRPLNDSNFVKQHIPVQVAGHEVEAGKERTLMWLRTGRIIIEWE